MHSQVTLCLQGTGKFNGVAYVQFENEKTAAAAKLLNNSVISGSPVAVDYAAEEDWTAGTSDAAEDRANLKHQNMWSDCPDAGYPTYPARADPVCSSLVELFTKEDCTTEETYRSHNCSTAYQEVNSLQC